MTIERSKLLATIIHCYQLGYNSHLGHYIRRYVLQLKKKYCIDKIQNLLNFEF
jgi:hypothetical protein